MALRVTKNSSEKADIADLGQLAKEGDQYLAQKDYDRAGECFRRGLKINPDYPPFHNGLGVVAYERGDLKEAERELRFATQLDPSYPEAWNNLGAVYIKRGRYSEAKFALERALQLRPELSDAASNLLWLYDHIFKFSNEDLPSLSLCMIVKNEAHNLSQYLPSVIPGVDEAIIVDTGSTDDTKDIARSLGAKVYDFPWRDDFAAARNEALRHAQGEWILVLDADEEIDEESLKKLKIILKYTDYAGFMLPIHSPLDTEGHNILTSYLVRVFRNHPDIRFQRRVHEVAERSLFASGKKVGRLFDIVIHHHGYQKEKETSAKVQERNYRLLLQALRDDPHDVDILNYLGKTHLARGETKIARAIFENVIRKSPQFNFAVLNAYLELGWIHHLDGDEDKALEYFEYLREKDPHLPDVYYFMGKVYEAQGRYEEALSALEKTLTVDHRRSVSPMVFFRVDKGDLYASLTRCASLLGEGEKARKYGEELQRYASADLFNNLGVEMINKNLWDRAEEYFRQALTLDARHPQARGNLLQLLFERGKIKEAQDCLREMKENLSVVP